MSSFHKGCPPSRCLSPGHSLSDDTGETSEEMVVRTSRPLSSDTCRTDCYSDWPSILISRTGVRLRDKRVLSWGVREYGPRPNYLNTECHIPSPFHGGPETRRQIPWKWRPEWFQNPWSCTTIMYREGRSSGTVSDVRIFSLYGEGYIPYKIINNWGSSGRVLPEGRPINLKYCWKNFPYKTPRHNTGRGPQDTPKEVEELLSRWRHIVPRN